ncbi:hypothetical protein GHT06_008091 [Daphnia sinensis]|uniref:Sedoheptulokinase n=1 Tax=Daphnia sinensis TaxID=1820382 RepID=A0AAD5LL76_9CRUS|nr:hypothetical protein GHT06_008091 [Daphnia sinensis]
MATGANFVLGLDLGTTSVKVCVVDIQSRKVVAKQSKDTQAGEGAEQDVSKIISAVHNCIGRIPRDLLKNVTSIGVCGQMHGVLLWNRETAWNTSTTNDRFELGKGQITSLYTWQDSRCTLEFLSEIPKPDSHLRIASGYGCATLLWKLKHEPEELSLYSCAGTIQDFLVSMLCDLNCPVMSVQNAASWGYFNTQEKTWNLEILKTVNFPIHLLPKVVNPGSVAGSLSKAWCGIPRGTQVLTALGDMQCSVLSTLANEIACTAVLNISTSAQLSFRMPADFTPPNTQSSIEYFPYFDDRYLAVAASLNGGNVMAAFVRMLQSWMQDLGFGVPQSLIWDKMLTLVKHANSAEQSMTIIPTLFGERHLSAVPAAEVFNINSGNISLGNVAKALFEGLVTNLHNMMSTTLLEQYGVTQLVGTGSALSRNQPLQQQVAAQYKNIPFKTVQEGDASYGAALATLAPMSPN